APTLTRVGALWNADDPALGLSLRETAAAAQSLRLEFRSLGVRDPSEFERAFRTAIQENVGALVVLEDNLTFSLSNRDCEARERQSAANHVRLARLRKCRRFNSVRAEPSSNVPEDCHLRGQDTQRR